MEIIFFIIAKVIRLSLNFVMICMIVRMFFPLFKNPEESNFYTFLSVITEPFIIPVRYFMQKYNILQGTPIDWSFTISYILLSIVSVLLPII